MVIFLLRMMKSLLMKLHPLGRTSYLWPWESQDKRSLFTKQKTSSKPKLQLELADLSTFLVAEPREHHFSYKKSNWNGFGDYF